MSIRILDGERRIIEVDIALGTAVHGKVFDYVSCRDSLSRAESGLSVRMNHSPLHAIGRTLGFSFDDTEQRVIAKIRISQAADAAWGGILDGLLSCADIGISDAQITRSVGGDLYYADYVVRYVSLEPDYTSTIPAFMPLGEGGYDIDSQPRRYPFPFD